MGIDHARKLIETGVMTGHPHDDSLLRVASLADALMRTQLDELHQRYTATGADRQVYEALSVHDAVARTPTWLDRFMDLAIRLRSRPEFARELPQLVQLLCFDALMGDQNWKAPAFQHLFTLEHRQLLNVALVTLREILASDLAVLSGLQTIEFSNQHTAPGDRFTPFTAPEVILDDVSTQPKLFGSSRTD